MRMRSTRICKRRSCPVRGSSHGRPTLPLPLPKKRVRFNIALSAPATGESSAFSYSRIEGGLWAAKTLEVDDTPGGSFASPLSPMDSKVDAADVVRVWLQQAQSPSDYQLSISFLANAPTVEKLPDGSTTPVSRWRVWSDRSPLLGLYVDLNGNCLARSSAGPSSMLQAALCNSASVPPPTPPVPTTAPTVAPTGTPSFQFRTTF